MLSVFYNVHVHISLFFVLFFFSSRRRHTRLVSDWSSDVCSSDLLEATGIVPNTGDRIRVSGLRYSVKNVTAVQPGGVPLMWKVHARGGVPDVPIVAGQIGRASCRERV